MRKGVCLVAVAVFFLASFGAAYATPWKTVPKFELEGIWWFSNLKATMNVGTQIDAKSDLGLDDTQFAEGRFTWYINDNHRIRLAVAHISNDGSASVQKEFEFGGTTFPVGASINSKIDFTYSRLGWTWEFINIGNNTFKFGTMLDAAWFILDPEISGSFQVNNSITELGAEKKFNLVLPTIGLAADYNPVKYINLFAEGEGIAAGKYGYMVDGEVGLRVIPVPWLSIKGAYRYMELKAKSDSDFAKVTYNGPYVGVTIRY